MLGRHGDTIERQILGGAGIMGNGTIKTKIKGGPDRGINTHAGHHAAQKQTVNLGIPELLQKGCLAKTVWKMLDNDRLIRQRPDAVMNSNPGCVRQKEARPWLGGNMLDMKQRPANLPKGLQQQGSACRSPLAFNQFHSATWEIVVLHIDDEQGSTHVMLHHAEICKYQPKS